MKHVAVVGTQGVPASYGGFETLVENIIGENCPPDIRYTIFCSSRDPKQTEGIQGMSVEIHTITRQWHTKHTIRYLVAVPSHERVL